MAINIELLECVSFLGPELPDGKVDCRGTAFFLKHHVSQDEDEIFNTPQGEARQSLTEKESIFAVTARHNIENARSQTSATAVSLRVNTKTGIETVSIDLDDWLFSSFPEIDVAAAKLEWNPDWEHRVLTSGFLLEEIELDAMKQQFGVGEEICITGLFSGASGELKNQPIARFGHLAAVNTHVKVKGTIDLIEAHLAEVHSISGLSGSPVFVKIQNDDTDHNKEHPCSISDPYWLLSGLLHGHFDVEEDDLVTPRKQSTKDHVNTGIAVVVTARQIRTALDEILQKLD